MSSHRSNRLSLLAACALLAAYGCARSAPSTTRQSEDGSARATLTANQAESAARSTKIVRSFLDQYAPCEGCQFNEPPGSPPHVGCVSYQVRESCPGDHSECPEMAWVVSYWVGPACSFRYQPSEFPVSVSVDRATGAILELMPETELVTNPTYCTTNTDCRCLSGSGVPTVGCANRFHASMHAAGSSACATCTCADHACRRVSE